MRRHKKKKYYAPACMIAILVLALLLTAGGRLLRRTLLSGLPQYDGAPDIAVPMMLLQDSGPLRAARERARWEAEQAERAAQAAQAPAETPLPDAPAEAPFELPPPPEISAAPEDDGVTVLDEPDEPGEEIVIGGGEAPGDETAVMPEPEPPRAEVDESYFDHTLFIGDSKTEEMRAWARLGQAQYFCGTNFSVYNVFDKTDTDSDFRNAKLDRVLRTHKYDQVYIMLGYNECDYPYGGLMEQFEYVIKRVRDAQPKARIILHGVMHANESVSGMYRFYSPENLEHVNDGLRAIAESYDNTYYVDCNEAFCDENGFLLRHVSLDGEHLLPDYSRQWAEEIRLRAIVDDEAPDGPA